MSTTFHNFSAECKEFVPRAVKFADAHTSLHSPSPLTPFAPPSYTFDGFGDYRNKMMAHAN